MAHIRDNAGLGIMRPAFEEDIKFEMKGQFLKELRENTFSGSEFEDANEHVEKVLEIFDLFHSPNVSLDHVMLRIFPKTPTGQASRWVKTIPPGGSITTWVGLKTKFLSKFFPPSITTKKMEEINNFKQETGETLYKAWERFNNMLLKCPQYELTEVQIVIRFYKGLYVATMQMLDSQCPITKMTAEDAKTASQEMVDHSQMWQDGASTGGRSESSSDGLNALKVQVANLGRDLKKTNEKMHAIEVGCEVCHGNHLQQYEY